VVDLQARVFLQAASSRPKRRHSRGAAPNWYRVTAWPPLRRLGTATAPTRQRPCPGGSAAAQAAITGDARTRGLHSHTRLPDGDGMGPGRWVWRRPRPTRWSRPCPVSRGEECAVPACCKSGCLRSAAGFVAGGSRVRVRSTYASVQTSGQESQLGPNAGMPRAWQADTICLVPCGLLPTNTASAPKLW
jgi:hypothetical protein